MQLIYVDVQLKSKTPYATYLVAGFEYHSFMGVDGVEYIRLPQRYVDHGFQRARWETPYIRVPGHALKIRKES